MLFSFFTTFSLLTVLLVSDACAQSDLDGISDPSKRAELAVSSLMQWYDSESGLWETTGWWNAANILTTIGNLAKINPDNAYVQTLAKTVFAVAVRHAPTKNPNPEAERPVNSSSRMARPVYAGTGYHKIIDATTGMFHVVYPDQWSVSSNRHVDLADLARQVLSNSTFATFTPDPYDFLDGYYDDDLWWALAWINAYDVTRHLPYLTLAEGIFNAVTKSWPTKCGLGGIYWNMTSGYVNAIANELFFSTAAHLANRASNDIYYLDWAKKSLNWFLHSGMINKNETINDGLNDQCKNNNGTVWSYNQGVILGGLVELYYHENDEEKGLRYTDMALSFSGAALDVLAPSDTWPGDRVLADPCEPANCGADGTQFKGIFMRNLIKLWNATGDLEDSDFTKWIRINADSIWTRDRRVDDQGRVTFGVSWDKFVGKADASTQSSAMDALVGDIWAERAAAGSDWNTSMKVR